MASPLPFPELTAERLQAQPVWRFLGDDDFPGTDESCLQATARLPAKGDYGSFVVAADYQLSDGRQLPGAVQWDQLGERVTCTPVLLFAGQKALNPYDNDLPRRLARLLRSPDLHPIRWTLRVAPPGERHLRSGRIPRSRLWRALSLLLELLILRLTPRQR